ncbi:hypothetical protein PSI22_15810 [Xenorhabdus sp. XENO-7]|uniref:Uncharacterized protein n=1 Tax=Xenorhabdus aichiensis TaxID=3025874 RepID=A0ABT5M6G1_9GAMM|nr:hypothetical protein [Xenorhabdus aichiensis]MDC9623061.1 hypothetical protein [Xenorhabdus aichiensis]
MSEDFSPLLGNIPIYPIEGLSNIAFSARHHLKENKRTDEQIIFIQKLIFELIDIYFQDERNKAIEELENQKVQELKYTSHSEYLGYYDDYYPDLYPFAEEGNRYGSYLVFIGDDSDLEIPTYENTNEIGALYEILDWMPDNESEEGFVDAEPSEYFAALTLSLVGDIVYFIDKYKVDSSTRLFSAIGTIGDVLLKSAKALSCMHELIAEKKHEEKLSSILEEMDGLKNKLDDLMGKEKKR